MLLQIPATIQKVETKQDNTLKIIVGTQELESEQKSQLMDLHNKLGHFCFAENMIQPEELPTENAPEFSNELSLSQRLRNVMFVVWKERTDQKEVFSTFREKQMEGLIQRYKNKLDD